MARIAGIGSLRRGYGRATHVALLDRKLRDGLRLVVVKQQEVFLLQVPHRVALRVAHHRAHLDQVHLHLKGLNLFVGGQLRNIGRGRRGRPGRGLARLVRWGLRTGHTRREHEHRYKQVTNAPDEAVSRPFPAVHDALMRWIHWNFVKVASVPTGGHRNQGPGRSPRRPLLAQSYNRMGKPARAPGGREATRFSSQTPTAPAPPPAPPSGCAHRAPGSLPRSRNSACGRGRR